MTPREFVAMLAIVLLAASADALPTWLLAVLVGVAAVWMLTQLARR